MKLYSIFFSFYLSCHAQESTQEVSLTEQRKQEVFARADLWARFSHFITKEPVTATEVIKFVKNRGLNSDYCDMLKHYQLTLDDIRSLLYPKPRL